MAWLCFWQREWGLEKWLQFWDQSKGLSDICKCLFVNLISLEYPVGGRGWCWCHAIGRGRWGRTHHATRQIGCDMDQHATLHPPWRRRGGHLRWGWRQKIRCPRLIYSAQCGSSMNKNWSNSFLIFRRDNISQQWLIWGVCHEWSHPLKGGSHNCFLLPRVSGAVVKKKYYETVLDKTFIKSWVSETTQKIYG